MNYSFFTAKGRDNETGLDYFGARYYASIQGRFSSPDPLLPSVIEEDPQSWNRYSYRINNPQKEYGYRNGQLLIMAEGSEAGTQNANWTS